MATARIDPARIVEQALALLREGGLEAVNLRRIAGNLGTGASSLYWHFRDKDALLAGVAQRIFEDCLTEVGEQPGWREWLHAFGMALWRAQVATPDIQALIAIARRNRRDRPESSAMEEIAGRLSRLGMRAPDAAVAQRSVQALVTGWTTLVVEEASGSSDDRLSFERSLRALIDGWGVTAAQD